MRNIDLINADIDGRLDAIHLEGATNSKESGLALLRLAQEYRPLIDDFLQHTPNSSEQLVGALSDLGSRIDYLLEEAERDLRTHTIVAPDDVEALEELVAILRALGRRNEATRIAEEARRLRLLIKNSKMSKVVSSEPDSSGLLFEQKTLELSRSLGFTSQTTSRTGGRGNRY
jgi:hypothetical protein